MIDEWYEKEKKKIAIFFFINFKRYIYIIYFKVNLNMIYAYDHLVPNKNKDDAHRSNHGNVFFYSPSCRTNFQFGGDPKVNIHSGEIEYVGCIVTFVLAVWLALTHTPSHFILRALCIDENPKMIELRIIKWREREKDAKRSHKNENENSIRQIKHKPKCPRELIILFYFVNRIFFWTDREYEPNRKHTHQSVYMHI